MARSGLLRAALLLGLLAAGSARAEAAPPDLRAQLEKVLAEGASGVSALVMKDGRLLYRVDVGDAGPDVRLPIASASKWMTAALIMTVVDEGKLSLDEPIGRRLPQFTGAAGQITLRQLMSFTAGQGSLEGFVDLRQDPHITLAQAADEIAARPLEDPPGATFRYGGPSLQVAGALVEQATGQRWADLFAARIAGPLGMSHTYWGNPLRPGLSPSEVLNPNLQAGVYTTADEYAAFLSMLAARGMGPKGRILSEAAFDQMETVQTGKAVMAYRPPGAAGLQAYGLGNWCETFDAKGRCGMVSSPGAFGTYPWIDRDRGIYGVFFLRSRLPLVVKDLTEARRMILAADRAGAAP
ncbi:serine hydrolase domain-containing protein [Phenylobacterium aquaticum]|uniref:serine hydrolase domain-containing protein n=1 Tax=Phenylobacterium aquaticum TaxID=1763816 RepID=UPI001F5D468B|nr:serine hydrolase domain-containing protein [Phenylobacterium aquaticum]MCI3135197.1 beta-lactamase family protein [Phenylobacterium aquaticum]